MDPEPQTLEEVEAEIMAILEDCQKRGLSKQEIREIFSPLGLPDPIPGQSDTNTDNNAKDIGDGDSISPRNRRPSGRGGEQSGNWTRTLFYVAIVIVGGVFLVNFYEEELKGIRFHALAIVRIALIKVTIKNVMRILIL